jgi:hypothetical protein
MPATTPNTSEGVKLEGNLAFVKEVAKYFMDFLETDFHKRKNPKRSVKLRNRDGLLVGLNLAKYPSFEREIFALIGQAFQKDAPLRLSRNVYRTSLPQGLLDLVKLQVSKIKSAEING